MNALALIFHALVGLKTYSRLAGRFKVSVLAHDVLEH
jgi:hypothetical protein